MKLYFDVCGCSGVCVEEILQNSGYLFDKPQENVWRHFGDGYLIEVVKDYNDGAYGLKIDMACENGVLMESKERFNGLAKILFDSCRPNKVYDAFLNVKNINEL
jgi:hypothetical protein